MMKHVCIRDFGDNNYRIREQHGVLRAEKKIHGRFSDPVVLAECVTEDFDVTVTEKYLHCVCRTDCEVLYFLFDGMQWHKKVLATEDGLYHNLKLISHGNFVHFLYTVTQAGASLLLHQLLGGYQSAPSVVAQATSFSAALHDNGDVSILYFQDDNVYLRRFVWSQKSLTPSCSIEFGIEPTGAVFHIWNDRILVAGFASSGSFVNLLCGEFTPKGETLCLAAVHLLSGKEEALCFSAHKEKLNLYWCESGTVMSAEYHSPGHWSSPIRYLPVTGREHVLLHTPEGISISYQEKDGDYSIL